MMLDRPPTTFSPSDFQFGRRRPRKFWASS
jgi:hypothetical protein